MKEIRNFLEREKKVKKVDKIYNNDNNKSIYNNNKNNDSNNNNKNNNSDSKKNYNSIMIIVKYKNKSEFVSHIVIK